ncbi:hypothetical protein SR870_20870 [Rhodopseudomonas palustris]|uniref:hypothetical protein n=1 Tax=Rhodopseudomonas palustris TaxID=1076 RepID=UPI002ACDF1A3|nr:hypothetical protein [Rhodopseudomonas palustris]WQG99102.1 hypothetical protein SR870_20870 [Rhodopseudomonas palustris]
MPPPAIPHRFLIPLSLAESKPDLQEASMFDFLMLLTGFGLFAVTIGYAFACERI